MAAESLTLDGVDLIASPYYLESIDFTLPASIAEWVKGSDSNGALLARPPLFENRVITARMSVRQQATMTLALAQIATIEDKLLECAQNANGLALVWTPQDTTTSITFRCLLGEITDIPISYESRYFSKAPEFGVRLTCLPFGEGVEYLAGSVTSSDPMQVLTITNVPGDVPALGRLVVTDAASQARRWGAWGLESRWLPTTSAPSLIVDSTSMTAIAGATATRTGAYSGASNNVISATLRTDPQAVCSFGNLTHVGSFRPQLRFYASATTVLLRLSYQALDGPFFSLSYKVPVAAGWNHVDLGLLSIPKVTLGSQRWIGRIEAHSTATGGETFAVDMVALMPTDPFFGRARATFSHLPSVVSGYDEFAGMTAATVLNARVAPAGGTWATSGAADDFTASADLTTETVKRVATTLGSRFAVLGSTNYTDTEVSVVAQATGAALSTTSNGIRMAAVARYVDSLNYCEAYLSYPVTGATFTLRTVVAGALTVLESVAVPTTSFAKIRLLVYASGKATAQLIAMAESTDNVEGPARTVGGIIASLEGTSAVLATGGTLATGKPGIRDSGDPVVTGFSRYYDSFHHAIPSSEPIVCHAGQSIEFRHDTVLREDASGTYSGPPPEYVGSRFTVPPAGGPGRQTRIAVMAKRSDVETATDDYIADSTTVQVYATPRYLAVPRP